LSFDIEESVGEKSAIIDTGRLAILKSELPRTISTAGSRSDREPLALPEGMWICYAHEGSHARQGLAVVSQKPISRRDGFLLTINKKESPNEQHSATQRSLSGRDRFDP